MPLYEYTCNDCRATFEAMAPMARRDQMDCPECGSKRTARLASTFCCSVDGGTGAGRGAAKSGAKSPQAPPACSPGG